MMSPFPNFPQSADVMGVTFAIEWVEEVEDENRNYGECDGAGRIIRLSTEENKTIDDAWRTLLHEKVHAVLYVTGQSARLEDNAEESIATAIENGLYPYYAMRVQDAAEDEEQD